MSTDHRTEKTMPEGAATRARWQIGQTTGLKTDAVLRECADLIDVQRDEIAKLRSALYDLQEHMRRREFPEPFRLRAVLGLKGDTRYALQIIRQLAEYPDVVVEVALP